VTTGRGTDIIGETLDTSTKRQRTPVVWNYFIKNVKYSRQVLAKVVAEYSSSKLLG